ncbi:MAG TPA: potassium-transporting ATPase subunit KdpA [Candidatus Lokiarchaeia archaeon]|nr:potassium-transporting ATPase subunit KdpA [Candidatus Lokiarchaeia archaeon]
MSTDSTRTNWSQIVRPAVTMFFLLMILTGVIYPLAITGISQVIFNKQANGSQITQDGKVVGSDLIGQPFSDPKYFWGRLSATPDFPYNANYSSGSNLGPNDTRLDAAVEARIAALHAVDPNNTAPIPVDLVTSSASGLDPDISVGAGLYQAPRIAQVRNLTENLMLGLISNLTQPRDFYVFGEPCVNVLELNLALDKIPNGTRSAAVFNNATLYAEALYNTSILGLQGMDWVELVLFIALIILLAIPLGKFIFKLFQRETPDRFEQAILQISHVVNNDEMNWKTYVASMLLFNALGIAFLFVLCELQGYLPLNPNNCPSLSPDLSFNVAVSFATNTNWQSYAGEAQLSYLTQMLGLTVQNFLSAATGIAILMATIRGLARKSATKLGNFWSDLVKGTVILLFLSSILAVFLVSQGCVQTFNSAFTVPLLQPVQDSLGNLITQQTIQVGPVASQVAIKILGSNGGGFFNVNGAHPFENPTAFTNFIECVMIAALPASFCVTFGLMVENKHEGMAIFVAMLILFLGFLILTIWAELHGNPAFAGLNIDQSGGNMEGKEVRFGPVLSSLYAVTTTATSNGSVNAMMESFTPLGVLGPLLLMQLGEIVFGGVGCGLYGMLVFVLVADFIASLMVGRTPEYLGKKLGPKEIKLITVIIVVPIITTLGGAVIAFFVPAAVQVIFSTGPHGFTEVIYAFTSAVANNGSAYAGLGANIPFYNYALAVAMLIGRYLIAVLTLMLAGSFVQRKRSPPSAGTLKTASPLFIGWLIAIILIIGVLSFIPVLVLGPIVEAML